MSLYILLCLYIKIPKKGLILQKVNKDFDFSSPQRSFIINSYHFVTENNSNLLGFVPQITLTHSGRTRTNETLLIRTKVSWIDSKGTFCTSEFNPNRLD